MLCTTSITVAGVGVSTIILASVCWPIPWTPISRQMDPVTLSWVRMVRVVNWQYVDKGRSGTQLCAQ